MQIVLLLALAGFPVIVWAWRLIVFREGDQRYGEALIAGLGQDEDSLGRGMTIQVYTYLFNSCALMLSLTGVPGTVLIVGLL